MSNFANITCIWFILFIGLLFLKYAYTGAKNKKNDGSANDDAQKKNADICKTIGILCILLDIIVLLSNHIHSTMLQICLTILGIIIFITIMVIACKGKR